MSDAITHQGARSRAFRPRPYALGHSSEERQRLRAQAHRLEGASTRFLLDAGLSPGMRVLELGTGLGHLTALVCRIVGAGGCVLSIDRSPAMLAAARETVRHAGTAVRFFTADLDDQRTWQLSEPFDALVGRLVLTHVADPVVTLRHALGYVRRGAVIAFQEADASISERLLERNRRALPLTCRACSWIAADRRGTGLTGPRPDLGDVFRRAGLRPPAVRLHTEVYRGACDDRVRSTVRMVREMMPRLCRQGVGDADVGIDTLEERMTTELTSANVVQARTSIASAWTTR